MNKLKYVQKIYISKKKKKKIEKLLLLLLLLHRASSYGMRKVSNKSRKEI